MSSHGSAGVPLPILQGAPKHKDPVCGMMVAPEKPDAKLDHAGKTYYFCSKRCAERFSREPEKFLVAPGTAGMEHGSASPGHRAMEHAGATTPVAASEERKIRYTCPMHPEIIRF